MPVCYLGGHIKCHVQDNNLESAHKVFNLLSISVGSPRTALSEAESLG